MGAKRNKQITYLQFHHNVFKHRGWRGITCGRKERRKKGGREGRKEGGRKRKEKIKTDSKVLSKEKRA